ncbi:hypothetical protein [Specibacter cremeus]|uniref:hypothetical protein n=1 Tax=Specibacter cremeus TaxID=1629051 RepID=UPI000F77A9F7|nr:hypothetical protein [Specibacter cremeus]
MNVQFLPLSCAVHVPVCNDTVVIGSGGPEGVLVFLVIVVLAAIVVGLAIMQRHRHQHRAIPVRHHRHLHRR